MIPESVATVLTFLGLVAPGLVYQLVLELREPRNNETAFREASRIALVSLLFSTFSILVFLAIQTLWPGRMVDLALLEDQGWEYVAREPLRLVLVLLGISAVATALSAGAAWRATRSSTAVLAPHGAWYQLFHINPPEGTMPWVHLSLTDGTDVYGYLQHYTDVDSETVREIVLTGPDLSCAPTESAAAAESVPGRWASVCVNAERISFMRVVYQDKIRPGPDSDPYYLRGRSTRDHPEGKILQ